MKVGDVLADDLLGALTIAGLDRGEDFSVFLDLLTQPADAMQVHVPHAQAVTVEAFECLREKLVMRGLGEQLVRTVIESNQLVMVAFREDWIGVGKKCFHRLDLLRRGALGSEAGGVRLQQDPHLENLLHVAPVHVGDDRAATGEDNDEVFEREPLERLTDGRPTKFQLVGQLLLIEKGRRRQFGADDFLFDLAIRPIAKRVIFASTTR